MAQPCKMLFWVKAVGQLVKVKGAPEAGIMTSVIWKLAREDAAKTKKEVQVSIQDGLGSGGPFGSAVTFSTFTITHTADPAVAMKMLGDATWTWKDDALALSLHSVTIDPKSNVVTDAFCTLQD